MRAQAGGESMKDTRERSAQAAGTTTGIHCWVMGPLLCKAESVGPCSITFILERINVRFGVLIDPIPNLVLQPVFILILINVWLILVYFEGPILGCIDANFRM